MKKTLFILILAGLSALGYSQMLGGFVQTGGGGGGIRLPLDSLIVGENGVTIDSIKQVGDNIYIYCGENVYSNDTITGLYGVSAKLDLLQPVENTLNLDNLGTKTSQFTHFMGFRKGGDSINFTATGAALNERNRIMSSNGVTLGVQSIVDGYMSVSAGTNTITSANDAFSSGNETVAGRRLYPSYIISRGNDAHGNYIAINGASAAGLSGNLPAIGSQVSYFSSVIDSSSYAWPTINFWDYPYFYTDVATRDDPALTRLGPVRLFCDSVAYDAVNNITKVYYTDSLLANPGWITSMRFNAKGTGMFSTGKFTSAADGEGASSFGVSTRAWGFAATAMGLQSMANAYCAFASGRSTTASGYYSNAMNDNTVAAGIATTAMGERSNATGQGSVVMGQDAYATVNDQYHIVYSSQAKTTNIGDNQAGLVTTKGTTTGVGPIFFPILRGQFNTSYTATSLVTAVQTDSVAGKINESGSWRIDWGARMGRKFVIDSINLTTNRVYFTPKEIIPVNTTLNFVSFASSAMLYTALGTNPGNLDRTTLFYVKTSSAGSMTLSTSAGGAERDITTFTAASYNTFAPFSVYGTQYLIGRTFTNDGDDVGNGTTTGIRVSFTTAPNTYLFMLYPYGLVNRTIRWASTTNYVMVKSE